VALPVKTCSLCLSCGGEEKAADTTTAANTTTEVAGAAADVASSAPTANLAAGKAYFDKTCMPCHGTTGKGDGAAAAALDPKPRDLSDMAWQDSVDDTYVLKVIVEGGVAVGKSPLMAAFGPAIDNDASVTAADVVAHVRSLGK
jgi:mono/diheme cytochrome c family protein